MFRMETMVEGTDAELTASLDHVANKNKTSVFLEVKVKEILEKYIITTMVSGGNAEVEVEIVSTRNLDDLDPLSRGKKTFKA